MKLKFILRGIPSSLHGIVDCFKKGKIAVTRYEEAENSSLSEFLNNLDTSKIDGIVLFTTQEIIDKGNLNTIGGWREYKLKKL